MSTKQSSKRGPRVFHFLGKVAIFSLSSIPHQNIKDFLRLSSLFLEIFHHRFCCRHTTFCRNFRSQLNWNYHLKKKKLNFPFFFFLSQLHYFTFHQCLAHTIKFCLPRRNSELLETSQEREVIIEAY